MDYKKKLRQRLFAYIIYIAIGIALICVSLLGISKNELILSFGVVFAAIGVVRIVQHFIITRNEGIIQKMEVNETDERNVAIWTHARSLAFTVYLILATLAVIVLAVLNQIFIAQIVSYMICALLVIYLICCLIAKRKY